MQQFSDACGPRSRASHRAATRLGLTASIAIALAACSNAPTPGEQSVSEARGLLRSLLTERCMATLPEGPRSTKYNDWDEVVEACSSTAYYQANHCSDPLLCIRVMFPEAAQGMAARSDETAQPVRPEGQQPGPKDAPDA